MWPFYEKACELDIALTMHTGHVLRGAAAELATPTPTRSTKVLLDFPELKIIAYHMGWPHTEELIGLAGKHQNLYLSMSGIVGWYERSPYRGYHAIGTALQWVDPSKIVMGLDLPFDDTKRVVDWVRNLQIPEELQKNYGYPEITDEMRAGFLGLNLARLAKIEPTKRVIGEVESGNIPALDPPRIRPERRPFVKDQACIVGIGETAYCRKPGSGMSQLGLQLQAASAPSRTPGSRRADRRHHALSEPGPRRGASRPTSAARTCASRHIHMGGAAPVASLQAAAAA